MNDKPPYELYSGPIDSPEKYVDFCIYQGRQAGKTYKLLMSIPNKPIVIVVYRHIFGQYMLNILNEIRPDYDKKNIKFVSYDYQGKYLDKLAGLHLPVYYDNAVLDMLQLDYVRHINRLYGEI